MKFYKLSYKKRGEDRMYWSSEYASSAAQAKEQAKAKWGDIVIISCVG